MYLRLLTFYFYFYLCTTHSDIHTVHSPTDAHFIKTLITIYINL